MKDCQLRWWKVFSNHVSKNWVRVSLPLHSESATPDILSPLDSGSPSGMTGTVRRRTAKSFTGEGPDNVETRRKIVSA